VHLFSRGSGPRIMLHPPLNDGWAISFVHCLFFVAHHRISKRYRQNRLASFQPHLTFCFSFPFFFIFCSYFLFSVTLSDNPSLSPPCRNTDPIFIGNRVQIIAPPHNSRRGINTLELFDQTGIVTREGSSSNGGWFEIRLDTDDHKRVYYRRGAIRLVDGDVNEFSDSGEDNFDPELDDDREDGMMLNGGDDSDTGDSNDNDSVSTSSILSGEGLDSPTLSARSRKRRKPLHPVRSFMLDEDFLYRSPWEMGSLSLHYDPGFSWPLKSHTKRSSSRSATTHITKKRTKVVNTGKTVSRSSSGVMECASCGVHKSPYWHREHTNTLRVLLCNACGIRFKKYKQSCGECTYVFRREEQSESHCPHCGIDRFSSSPASPAIIPDDSNAVLTGTVET